MEKRTLFNIFAVCVLLAASPVACNRRVEDPPKEEVRDPAPTRSTSTTVAAKPDTRKALVTFGDSLTQGVAGKSYPAYLQDLLDQNGFSYRVDNQGVSGDTTTDGLARIDNVVAANPALVVLEFGGNDGLRGIPVESSRSNLEAMIQTLQRARVPLVLAGITLPPNYGPEYVKPFTAMFSELSKQYKVRLLPFLLLHEYQNPALMQPDGIHPNGEGNRLVAKDVYDLIRPMLKK